MARFCHKKVRTQQLCHSEIVMYNDTSTTFWRNFYERKWAVIFEVILLPLLRMKLRRGLFSNSTFLSCSVLYVCMVLWEAGLGWY